MKKDREVNVVVDNEVANTQSYSARISQPEEYSTNSHNGGSITFYKKKGLLDNRIELHNDGVVVSILGDEKASSMFSYPEAKTVKK